MEKPRTRGGESKLLAYDYKPKNNDNVFVKGMEFVGKNIIYPILKPLLKAPKRKEKVEKIEYYGGKKVKKVGGKAMKDMTPAELQALDDARTANAIWAKSKAAKEYKANIADLTDKEKLANARNTARKWGKDVYEPKIAKMEEEYQTKLERQKQEASRQQLGEEVEFQKAERRRLAEEAKKKKGSLWDDIANVAIGELVNLIPAPKVVKDVLKTGAKEGYSAASKALGGEKPMKSKVGMSLSKTRRQPLVNQHPELEGNKLLDKMLIDSVFNHQNELLKNGMRQELAYPPISVSFGEGKLTGSKKYNKNR